MTKSMNKGDCYCERCGEFTLMRKMSYFNTDMLCLDCQKEEIAHPEFQHAKNVEAEHVRQKNYNFPGIGLPEDLKQKYCKDEIPGDPSSAPVLSDADSDPVLSGIECDDLMQLDMEL